MTPKWSQKLIQEGLGGGFGSDPGKKGGISNPCIICYTSSTSAKPLGLHFWSLRVSKSSQSVFKKVTSKNDEKYPKSNENEPQKAPKMRGGSSGPPMSETTLEASWVLMGASWVLGGAPRLPNCQKNERKNIPE